MLSTNLKLNLVSMNKNVPTGTSSGVCLIQSNLAVGSHFSFLHLILIFCVFFFLTLQAHAWHRDPHAGVVTRIWGALGKGMIHKQQIKARSVEVLGPRLAHALRPLLFENRTNTPFYSRWASQLRRWTVTWLNTLTWYAVSRGEVRPFLTLT